MTDDLVHGFYDHFKPNAYGSNDDPLMPRLVREGQNPDYFVISCIDSRSNPGTIFHTQPGTFFGFKAMGAIVRPYHCGTALSSALQYAIEHTGVRDIVILGHTCCGAIEALADHIQDHEIASFIDVAQKGLTAAEAIVGPEADRDLLLRTAEQQIALQSCENLKSYPSVQKALEEDRLHIHCWVFDMEHGRILSYNDGTDSFSEIQPPAP